MIGLILGFAGALLIGLVIGHTWGVNSGFKSGVNAARIEKHVDARLVERHREITKVQSMLRLCAPKDMPLDTCISQNTWAVYALCEKLAKDLLHKGIIVPKIVGKELGHHQDIIEILISLYVAPDPSIEDYPGVVFLRRD